ncbi:HD domain-containing phosphohydrolase [Ferrimonas senticii]|uniref:HD domain-containing phosphohydrolase n=1 Tax=Ferrimonas senticii TaxID=394566 RepID=UPI0004176318|nr:HD domain-containing phosphohydrolase [Ferrimonas senticii]
MLRNRTFSIQAMAAGLLVLATLITGAVVIGVQYHFTKQMIQQSMVERFSLNGQLLSAQISKIDRDANYTVALLAQLAEPLLTGEHRQQQMQLLRQALEEQPAFYSAYIGFGDDRFLQLFDLNHAPQMRQQVAAGDNDRWVVSSYQAASENLPRIQTTEIYDQQFQLTRQFSEVDNYFPSQRTWFKQAQQHGNHKTDPYQFFEVDINGQSYSHRIGDTDAVIAIDVVLASIAKMIQNDPKRRPLSAITKAYLVDQYGEVLATNQQSTDDVSLPPSQPLLLTEAQQQFIAHSPTLRVSNQDAWEPMDFTVGGVPKGYAIDLFTLIGEMTGLKFRFSNGQSWAQLQQAFIAGEIDILQSSQRHQDNQQLGRFSTPMFTMPFALATLETDSITELLQWQGRRLGILAGWSVIPLLKQHYPDITIIEFNELKPAFDALRDGQIDGVLGAKQILQYKQAQYYLNQINLHDNLSDLDALFDGHYYMVVADEQPLLQQILNKALANISREQHQALDRRWLSGSPQLLASTEKSTLPYKKLLQLLEQQQGLGSLQLLTVQGQPTYVYADKVSSLSELNDYFVVAIPEQYLVDQVTEQIRGSVLFTAAIIVLLLPLAWLFSQPVVRPILQLRRETQKIKRRQFEQVAPVPTSISELADLSGSVQQMADTIAAHEQAQKAFIESIIKLIANAIDQKSPYTAGHCHRVPELGIMLMEAVEQAQDGPFAGFHFNSDDERREFRIAAWLHDCGKITTPDHIVDKGSKLEAIYNRIHEVRMRFEVLWRDAEIKALVQQIAQPQQLEQIQAELAARQQQLQQQFAFVAECNIGGERFSEQQRQQLQQIATQTWQRHFDDRLGLSPLEQTLLRGEAPSLPATEALLSDKPQHRICSQHDHSNEPSYGINMAPPELLQNLGELYNLSIERGTLTPEDRYRINEHMVSGIKMLESLPFPPELSRVPRYATSHHETLIGSGYPRGLTGEQLSVPEQALVIADIFEALTAADRPYKRAKTLSESIQIMTKMANRQHFDKQLFALFLRSGTYLRYAHEHLDPAQIDEVDIQHCLDQLEL